MGSRKTKLALSFLVSALLHSLILVLPESSPVQGGSHIIPVRLAVYSPSQTAVGHSLWRRAKPTRVSPRISARSGPPEALAKEGASADSAEAMKDATGIKPWRVHHMESSNKLIESPWNSVPEIKKETRPARKPAAPIKKVRRVRVKIPHNYKKVAIPIKPKVITKPTIRLAKRKQISQSPGNGTLPTPTVLPKKSEKEKKEVERVAVKKLTKETRLRGKISNATGHEKSQKLLRNEVDEPVSLEETEADYVEEPVMELAGVNSSREMRAMAKITSMKQGISNKGNLHIRARYARVAKPKYPSEALRNGWEGTTILRVLVDRSGRTTRVELHQSSGFQILDRAALGAVKAWRFVPAYRGDRTVESWVKIPVVFRLADRNVRS